MKYTNEGDTTGIIRNSSDISTEETINYGYDPVGI